MRIIGGQYKGKKLTTPTSDHIRPTTDRMRETLFNMLEHGTGPGIRGSKVLDLFAGTGALGIEALSRHAGHVTFIDKDQKAIALVKQNTATLNKSANISYLCMDSLNIRNLNIQFDIIFIDPPYHKGLIPKALAALHENNIIANNGLCIIEYASNEVIDFIEVYKELKMRKIGEATFSILEYLPSAE